MLVHDVGPVGRGAGVVIEPEAMRYAFDGHGWMYIDDGAGSSWQTRHLNAEPLFTAEALAEARAEERAKNVALLRELAAKALKAADMRFAASLSQDGTSLLVNTAEAFETAAFAIEAGEDGA